MMLKGQWFILLVFCVHNISCSIDILYAGGKEVWKLYLIVNDVQITSNNPMDVYELFAGMDDDNQEIKDQLGEVHKYFDKMETVLKANGKLIHKPLRNGVSADLNFLHATDMFDALVASIDKSYELFHSFLNNDNAKYPDLLRTWVGALEMEIVPKMIVLRKILFNETSCVGCGSLLSLISDKALKLNETMCGQSEPIASIVFRMFKIMMMAEMKVDVMTIFTNIFQYVHNDDWRRLNAEARVHFERQFAKIVHRFLSTIDSLEPLYMRACDPQNGAWTRDKSFYELEGTFQISIFRYHWALCKYSSCNSIWFEKNDACEARYYDKRSGCSDTPAECAYLSAIEACVLEKGPYKFQYVNSSVMGLLGNATKCPRNNSYFIKDGSGWDFSFAACACNCYGSHNKISLALTETNVAANRVIIGVRFLRQQDILYIQLKEGKLDGIGEIIRGTERWLPIPKQLTDEQISTVDRERKVFFLEDLKLPPNHVLTGVKINEVTRGDIQGFALEIFGVPVEYKAGELKLEVANRLSVRPADHPSSHGLSYQKVSPLHTKARNEPTSSDIKYVQLERSDIHADFGQATLPFFDAVEVATNSSSLGGLGLFHKGVDGYAGFLSLRAFPLKCKGYLIDFSIKHIKNDQVVFNN